MTYMPLIAGYSRIFCSVKEKASSIKLAIISTAPPFPSILGNRSLAAFPLGMVLTHIHLATLISELYVTMGMQDSSISLALRRMISLPMENGIRAIADEALQYAERFLFFQGVQRAYIGMKSVIPDLPSRRVAIPLLSINGL
jgi:hypothetical protein